MELFVGRTLKEKAIGKTALRLYMLMENFKGLLHRENGPAVIFADGDQYWYTHGKYIKSE